MHTQNYFSWLTSETVSKWTNDSGILAQNIAATKIGAVGCTTNPPLSFEALTTDTALYAEGLAKIDKNLPDDEFATEAMGLVIRQLSTHYLPMHKEKGTYHGCVRAQVRPSLRNDAEGMLKAAKLFSSWGENVMVKIPVTEAGIWVLEELAALGIPTNPTVTTSVSQAVAAAEAYERGIVRAKAAGITPAWTTEAIVMGRLQDYLAQLNEERSAGLATTDLEWACIAFVKRTREIFKKKGYASVMQPAAFRSALQVEQISGAEFCSTIHPKVQQMVEEADAAGTLKREALIDAPVDKAAVDRVCLAFPEFVAAYEPDAIAVKDFATSGPTQMTLDGFDQGWQKIFTLKK